MNLKKSIEYLLLKKMGQSGIDLPLYLLFLSLFPPLFKILKNISGSKTTKIHLISIG